MTKKIHLFIPLFLIISAGIVPACADEELKEPDPVLFEDTDLETINAPDDEFLIEGIDDQCREFVEKLAQSKDDFEKLKKQCEANKTSIDCKKCASLNEHYEDTLKNLQNQIDELREEIEFLDDEQVVLQDSLEAVQSAPSPDFLAENNFVCVGTSYLLFRAPNDNNETFDVVVDPVFLWRFKDRLLFELKLDIRLHDCDTDIEMVYGVIDYIWNDCLIIRAGKFSTPLGLVWEKMTTGWINKLPTLPAPYTPGSRILTPPGEVGVDFRGVIPIAWKWRREDEVCIPIDLCWDFWVSNGPDEEDGDIRFGCNYLDNNHNLAVGGRLALRPKPFREIAISGMYAQWNNNKHREPRVSDDNLWYTALVLDWNWGINEYSKVMGEVLWTQRDAIKHVGFADTRYVTEFGGWFQYSTFLSQFNKRCEELLDKWEFVMRYGFVDSDVKDSNRNQFTVGLNYFFSNVLILKGAYELSHGRVYPNHEFLLQLAHAY